MLVSKALDFFLGACYIKGLSERTIKDYEEFVGRFIKAVGDIGTNELNYDIVQQYIHSLFKRDISKATIGTYIRHLKVFVKYLENENYIEKMSDQIKVPRMPKKVVKIYDDDELKQIFEIIDIRPDWLKYRNCCVIALMLDSGLRLNEVCEIGIADYDARQNLLLVHGKGSKERLVPIGRFTRYYLKRYLASLPNNISFQEQKALFVNRDGSRITRNTIKLLVQKMSNRLPFEFSSHKLRHNFATNYCIDEYMGRGQVDIYKLMVLLGHEDIKTTRRYLHLANQIIVSKSNISHLDKVFTETV